MKKLGKLLSIVVVTLFVFLSSVGISASGMYGDGSQNTKKHNDGGYGSGLYWNTATGSEYVATGSGGSGNLGVNIGRFKQGWGSISALFLQTTPDDAYYQGYNIVPTPNPSAQYVTQYCSHNVGANFTDTDPYVVSLSVYGDEEASVKISNLRITFGGVDYTPQGAIDAGLIEPMFLIMSIDSVNLNSMMTSGTSTFGINGYHSVGAVAFVTKVGHKPDKVSWTATGEWVHITAWKTAEGAPAVSSEYDIHFDSNGGQGTMADMTNLQFGTEYALTENAFTKYGYYFAGWSTTATGAVEYFDGQTVQDLGSSGTVNLYAQWTPRRYNIMFLAPTATGGSTPAQTDLLYDTSYNLNRNGFVKEGYEFLGWSRSQFATEPQYTDGQSIKNLFSTQTEQGSSEMLFAVWRAVANTVTLEGDRGVESTSGAGDHITDTKFTISGTLLPGFAFDKWTGESTINELTSEVTMPGHASTWKLNTTPIPYDINYDVKGGLNNPGNPATYTTVDDNITIGSPTKDFYDFIGWTGSNGETPQVNPILPSGSLDEKEYIANWNPTEYTITYSLGGGTNHPENPSSYNIESEDIILQDPTYEGRTFIGWEEGSVIAQGSSGNKTFTAQWELDMVKLNYHPNNGEGNMQPTEGLVGYGVLVADNAFTRDGYKFAGWNTKADGTGNSYEEGGYYTLNAKDNDLYAQWDLVDYKVNYVLNGATNDDRNPTTYTTDKEYTLYPATKHGYKSLGWEEGNSIPVGSTGDKTFTAQLEPNKYNVVFDGNHATSGSMAPQEIPYGTATKLNPNGFVNTGYNFMGWSYNSEGFDVDFEDQEEVLNLSDVDGAEIKLYAIWEEKPKDVTYSSCGGPVDFEPQSYTVPYFTPAPEYQGADLSNNDYTFVGWSEQIDPETGNVTFCPMFNEINKYTITFDYNYDGSPDNVSVVYNEGTQIDIIGVPERPGYNFLYWKGSEYQPGAKYTVSEDHTFTAQWEIVNYDISYILPQDATNNEANPVTYTVEDTVTLLEPSRPGYDFLGWQEGSTIPKGSIGNKSFTALWEKQFYNITYETGPCPNHEDNPSQYSVTDHIIFRIPACPGYTVEGWEDGNELKPGTTGDIVKKLIYKMDEFSILYTLNGGKNHKDNPSSYNYNSEEIVLKPASRDYYNFNGWDPEGVIPHNSTGSKIFAATWKPIPFAITYNLPEGATNDDRNPSSYTVEDDIHIYDPVLPEYKFVGWKEGNKIPKGSHGERTFTAIFEPIGYTIRFNCAEGTGTMPEVYAPLNEEVKLPKSTCVYKGHKFTGWEYNGKVYQDEATIKALMEKDGGTAILKALYEIENYGIEYILGNGGVNHEENPKSYTVNDEFELKAPTRPGYMFESWSPTNRINKGSIGPMKFTAMWKAIEYKINYDLGDGASNNPENPNFYTIESGDIVLKDPSKAGCVFKGWSPAGRIAAGSIGEITFKASWDCTPAPTPAPTPAGPSVNTGFGNGTGIALISSISSLIAALHLAVKRKKDSIE